MSTTRAGLPPTGVLEAGLATGIGMSTQVASSQHLHLGSTVAVIYPTTGTKDYIVQVIYSVRDVAGDYVLPLAAAQANFPSSLDIAIFVKLAPGVTTSAARPAIDRVLAAYPTATLQDQDQYKASAVQSYNTLLNLVYGLLALAVLIALIGIANTLALSIYERTRELGLLRAVGVTSMSCCGKFPRPPFAARTPRCSIAPLTMSAPCPRPW